MLYYLTEDQMPNYSTHVAVGAPTGLACAVVNSLNQSGFNVALEAFGGWCGGTAGAVLPDIFDPPDHTWNRSGWGCVPVLGWEPRVMAGKPTPFGGSTSRSAS